MESLVACVAFLAAFLFSVVATCGLCSRPLKVSVAESWPPAVLKTLERYRQPFKEIGCEVDFEKVPLSRSMLLVSKGQLDGDTFRIEGFENDFPHLIRVRAPMARFRYYFYKKVNSPIDINQRASLVGRKTCLTLGNRLRVRVAKELNLKVVETANTVQCLKMLSTGRVDVFFGPRLEVEDPSLQEYNVKLIRAMQPYVTANLYIYLNDRYREVAEKLERHVGRYYITDDE